MNDGKIRAGKQLRDSYSDAELQRNFRSILAFLRGFSRLRREATDGGKCWKAGNGSNEPIFWCCSCLKEAIDNYLHRGYL